MVLFAHHHDHARSVKWCNLHARLSTSPARLSTSTAHIYTCARNCSNKNKVHIADEAASSCA
eukprot:1143356-Pelagomonas_calceolata.AAC.3